MRGQALDLKIRRKKEKEIQKWKDSQKEDFIFEDHAPSPTYKQHLFVLGALGIAAFLLIRVALFPSLPVMDTK